MIPHLKCRFFLLLLLCNVVVSAQRAENVIIITTDGFRWQELFGGMDSAIANDPRFNQGDSAGIYQQYWAANATERRKKLLPFMWTMLAKQGQLYGNRSYNNLVNNANPYWFSYPGYSELFTGHVDTLVNSNDYPPNPNSNLLKYLQRQPRFRNQVAAFGAWEAFGRILNRQRSGIPVVNAFDSVDLSGAPEKEKQLDKLLRDSYKPFGNSECLDVFTHYQAVNYLQRKRPKVLYIGYGETDDWAHHAHYKDYLHAATQVDRWIADLWTFIQSDATYQNKTLLVITTDHGRGDAIKAEWTNHGASTRGSNEIWLALMGPGVAPVGEVTTPAQYYQQQFAQTIARLLGTRFNCEHPVAEGMELKR